ncbi:MAG: exonuclease domain-containing protein [Flavobacterium sp.]|nr:exonuclease domain-containing protein [Flavobacterium sp.]
MKPHNLTPIPIYSIAFDTASFKTASNKNQNVVAHNGFAFDFHCLKQTLDYYEISTPEFTGHCTYRIFGDNLASLCNKYKINLNHHDALSDARACAQLFNLHLNKNLNFNGIR